MEKDSKIYIAGGTGMVGSSIIKRLLSSGYTNIVSNYYKRKPDLNLNLNLSSVSFVQLDLRRQEDTEKFFENERPEYVFLAAAKVGGILANINNPASFIYDNLLIQSNVIHSAYKHEAKKLLFISSSCSYPRLCSQPMKEEYILSGKPEPTNESYALAKIAGMKMIEAYYKQYRVQFFSLIFPNIYGPGDNFDLNSSHVIPALIRKIYEAKINNMADVEIWGTGNAKREFLYVDDVANACVFFMGKLNGGDILNVGAGVDSTIKELAYLVKNIIGYEGNLIFNTSKPDGMPQKLLDSSQMNKYGWHPKISLQEGVRRTLEWYIQEIKNINVSEQR